MNNMDVPQILDANRNRISEGLRVIEEHLRFVSHQKELAYRVAQIRHDVGLDQSLSERISELHSRNTAQDMRAKDPPTSRKNIVQLLTANFKRVTEALRVLEEYTGDAKFNTLRYDMYDLEKTVILTALKPQINGGIYLVSDQVDVLKKGVGWGVSIVQIRDKHADKATILEKARVVKGLVSGTQTRFIVNDHVDIALLVDADGVHTGQDDIAVSDQRKLLGEHKIIGRTTHSLEQGLVAQKDGADYVSVGPIWETPSKPGRDGIGFDYLRVVSDCLDIPYVAIGGIDIQNCDEVLQYHPPLLGLIRDYENIPEIQRKIKKTCKE